MQSNYYSASTWIKPHLRGPKSLPVIMLVTDMVSRHEYLFYGQEMLFAISAKLNPLIMNLFVMES